jgi:predicted nucleic acid-binding protein
VGESVVTFCDTSFLFSLYVHNEHTDQAMRFARRRRASIQVGMLVDYEFYNALQFADFSGRLSEADALLGQARYRTDLQNGALQITPENFQATLEKAKGLTRRYLRRFGLRAFDALHVASALQLGAETFLTFDRLQQKLAVAEGLKSPW